MKPYSLLVFDWDGTLCDTLSHMISCFHKACEDLGFSAPSDAAIRRAIPKGVEASIAELLPALSPQHQVKLLERYRYFYCTATARDNLFPGILPMLSDLKAQGYQLAVATGKSRQGLDKALVDTGLEGVFVNTQTVDEHPSKPNPEMLNTILNALDISADNALMIGDSEVDMQLAQNAGVFGVYITDKPDADLQAFDNIKPLAHISELVDYLKP